MSEQSLVAELADNQGLVEKYLTKIKSNLDKAKKVDPSDQKRIKTQITNDFKSTLAVIETMKLEIQSLKEESNESRFRSIIKNLDSRYKSMNEEYKKSLEQSNQTTVIDTTLQKATGQESSLEVMNKGDAILDESGKAIERMEKKVNDAKDISKNIKSDLKRQMEQLDNTNKNLKEIDYSLGRAAKTLGNMAKIVASDKFIMAMIIMVLLLIVGIIVYSSILGEDAPKEFNAITDIFGGGVAKAKVSTEIKK